MKRNKRKQLKKAQSDAYMDAVVPIKKLQPGDMLEDGTIYVGGSYKDYKGAARKLVKAMDENQKHLKMKVPLNIHTVGEQLPNNFTYVINGLMIHESGEVRLCFK